MDIEYKEVIDYSGLKKVIDERGYRYKFIADRVGLRGDVIGRIFRNEVFPKTDLIAKICKVLEVPASQIVEFKITADDKKAAWFKERDLPYTPPSNSLGDLTYEPLRLMISMYLDYLYEQTGKEKTADDLFDLIEPYRRRNGIYSPDEKAVKASLVARGFSADYKSERTDRKYKAVGLTSQTRLKLKKDRPLNIRAIYDICNFFGCSIDWVMSYK